MEAIITRNWVGHPLTTMEYTAQDRRCTGGSYGWRICRESHAYIEAELLDLIMQCQFEKPADRPQLAYLLRKICDRKYRGFQELDHETRTFWDDFWARTKTSPVPLSQGLIVEIPGPGNGGSLIPQATNRNISPGDPHVATLRRKSRRSPLSDSSTDTPIYPRPQTAFGHRSEAEGINPAGITHVAALRRKSHRSPLSASSTDSPTGLYPQPAFTHGSRAARTNPAVMTRVPSLRRKSHRSPLSMSSTGSSIHLSHRRPSMFGQTAGAGPATNPPLSALGTPVRETNQQKRSSRTSSRSGGTSNDRRDAKKRKRVQFGRFPASTAQTIMTSTGNAMDISMDDGPESADMASMMDLDEDEDGGEAMEEDEEDELMGEDSW